MFFVAKFEDIKKGKVTDVYFVNTLEILKKKGIDKRVRAEFIVKRLPEGDPWAVFAGLEGVSQIIEGLNVKVRAMKEETIFRPYQPILEIEGMYTEFGILETAIRCRFCNGYNRNRGEACCEKRENVRSKKGYKMP